MKTPMQCSSGRLTRQTVGKYVPFCGIETVNIFKKIDGKINNNDRRQDNSEML